MLVFYCSSTPLTKARCLTSRRNTRLVYTRQKNKNVHVHPHAPGYPDGVRVYVRGRMGACAHDLL